MIKVSELNKFLMEVATQKYKKKNSITLAIYFHLHVLFSFPYLKFYNKSIVNIYMFLMQNLSFFF